MQNNIVLDNAGMTILNAISSTPSGERKSDKLPRPIQNFLIRNRIHVINNEGYFGGGIDPIFYYLTQYWGIDVALRNLESDKRLSESQRDELRTLIKSTIQFVNEPKYATSSNSFLTSISNNNINTQVQNNNNDDDNRFEIKAHK